MNIRFLMIASAIAMGLMGLTSSFLPDELLLFLGVGKNGYFTLVFQLLGSISPILKKI